MLGIYIHIPFCKQKCKYCDFNSYSGIENMSSSYVEMLVREIECCGQTGRTADTIYIGGGTPTYISAGYIKNIMDALRENFVITDDAEVTIECNPGTADFEKLARLKQAGINRLSIGLQSDNDKILKTLGRIHTYEEFRKCLGDALKAGFENISADLMFGLPGQTRDIWINTLKNISVLPLSHISAYSLKIEEGTPFYNMYKNGSHDIPDDDMNRIMYDDCTEILTQNGFERYEISNFARDKKLSRHNMKYWQCENYIGFGAGACSCIGGKRTANIRGVSEYIEEIRQSGSAVTPDETVINTISDSMSEFVFLGLRLDKGVSKADFKSKFGMDIYEVFDTVLDKHLNRTKTITDTETHIKIKPEYTYVSNAIMADFV